MKESKKERKIQDAIQYRFSPTCDHQHDFVMVREKKGFFLPEGRSYYHIALK